MALGDMEHDRPCLEQGEVAFLIGRNLAERMKRQMRGFLHRAKRNKANLVGLTHFLKRPANARITRQSLPAIGRPFKSGDGGGHWNGPGDWITQSCVTKSVLMTPTITAFERSPDGVKGLARATRGRWAVMVGVIGTVLVIG